MVTIQDVPKVGSAPGLDEVVVDDGKAQLEPLAQRQFRGAPQTAEADMPTIETDVLIVGTGPAGGALASFLASHGVQGLFIGMYASTARTPRAHFTNMAGFECLRELGLEQEARRVGEPRQLYSVARFSDTMVGTEYLRTTGFTSNPKRHYDYTMTSPCEHADVPQNLLEPILVKYATQHGFKLRLDSKLESFHEDPETGLVTSIVIDGLTTRPYKVISKYLCGADGGNSIVASQLGLGFTGEQDGGLAFNVWYEADLSSVCRESPGLLHTCFAPGKETPPYAIFGVNRFIKPWNEWLMILLAAPGISSIDVSNEELVNRTKELIGDPNIPFKLKSVSKWRVQASVATTYSKGNVFCLGDAVHRHTPGNGLGSNTGIQDSYNLAWKIAHVIHSKAGKNLLNSYSIERQPIGKRVVTTAMNAVQAYLALIGAMGLFDPSPNNRLESLKSLGDATPESAQRRAAIRGATEMMEDERSGLGVELNQDYSKGGAVYADDEHEAPPSWPEGPGQGVQFHVMSTYPGFRLPHAWLGSKTDHDLKISTHDLAGRGRFTLFTGIGGKQAWQAAAAAATKATGIAIDVFGIGWAQDYEDTYYMWEDRRQVAEDGCVLSRPDRTVGWRSQDAAGAQGDKLTTVIKRILSLD